MCAGSADFFQSALDLLLQKKSLPSFSSRDCPQISPIGIATASFNLDRDCSNPPLPRNNMTAAFSASESLTDVVNFAAPETTDVPDADVSVAVSTFLTLFRNKEKSFTQN